MNVSPAGPPEHPLAATRRLALERLRQMRPQADPDDREDCVAEAMSRMLKGGQAERPEAWVFVASKALRLLLGRQKMRGRWFACRNGVTPCATHAMGVWDPESHRLEPRAPDEWLDWTACQARHCDPEAALDLAARLRRWVAAGVDRDAADLACVLRRLVAAGLTTSEIARTTGADFSTARKWLRGDCEPTAAREAVLRDLLADRLLAGTGGP